MRRRVKITGIGPVTPAGIGRESFFHGINENLSHTREVTRFDPRGGPFIASEILNFHLSEWVGDVGNPKKIPRQTQFAITGALLALADAGISLEELHGTDPVVVNGSSLPDPELMYRMIAGVVSKGPGMRSPGRSTTSSRARYPARSRRS